MELLVVEDDARLRQVLRQALEENGHHVMAASDGAEGLDLARQHDFDVIVLDVMLQSIDGVTLTRQIRRDGRSTPIVMITARDEVKDVVRGLDEGADDYLTKPFALEELYARIRAVTRRKTSISAALEAGGIRLDVEKRLVTCRGRALSLTKTEFRILELLMRRWGRVISRNAMLDLVWNSSVDVQPNTVEAYVSRLRSKLDGIDAGGLIETVRGFGYSIREGPDE